MVLAVHTFFDSFLSPHLRSVHIPNQAVDRSIVRSAPSTKILLTMKICLNCVYEEGGA